MLGAGSLPELAALGVVSWRGASRRGGFPARLGHRGPPGPSARGRRSKGGKQAAAARDSEKGALDLIRFMDSQVDEAFVDAVPVPQIRA